MACWLNNPIVKNYMTGAMSGAGITRLTLAKIKAAKFAIPPINKQRDFAERMNRIGCLRDKSVQGSERCNLIFASLQHRAFAGELN